MTLIDVEFQEKAFDQLFTIKWNFLEKLQIEMKAEKFSDNELKLFAKISAKNLSHLNLSNNNLNC